MKLPINNCVIPPLEGWKAHTWYLVDVAYSSNNPIHRSLLYTGFLNGGKDNDPGGYSQLVALNTPSPDGCSELRDAYYIKVIKKLFSSKELEKLKLK